MTVELKIPDVGESIQEVQIGRWLKQEGDRVEEDEDVVELETDKASMELPAPAAGVLAEIVKREGDTVSVGETIGYLKEDGQAKTEKKERPAEPKQEKKAKTDEKKAAALPDEVPVTPSARRALREHGLRVEEVEPAGDRLRREDVLRYVEQRERTAEKAVAKKSKQEPAAKELEEIVPMSLIRRRIAERLVEAQKNAALVTTFNEIDLSGVQDLRKKHRTAFEEKYAVKLGFMSFFVKAAVDALKQFSALNAEIRGTDIVYRNYYHVGIAIGSEKGLVVPVLRYAERMSFAEIEQAIGDFARRAGENKLKPDELEGGTFTISNGGIYGSLLSTPIVNPPQSGVLGMHVIQERPVAVEGEVVIRPMMYVALTYDHRLVDGREAVSFLRRIKEAVEEPSRMLIEV